MFSRQFRARMAVVLELPHPDKNVLGGAVIAEVWPDVLWLDAPHPREELRNLEPGTAVRLRGSDRAGSWFADTTVLETARTPLAFRLAVERPRERTPERRTYFREPVRVPVHLVLHAGTAIPLNAVTTELGGNGLRAEVHVPVPPGVVVDVTIPLPGQGPVNTRGRVVRCRPAPSDGAPRYCVAVRFEGIADHHQERIVGWLLEVERARNEAPQ